MKYMMMITAFAAAMATVATRHELVDNSARANSQCPVCRFTRIARYRLCLTGRRGIDRRGGWAAGRHWRPEGARSSWRDTRLTLDDPTRKRTRIVYFLVGGNGVC